MDTNQLMKNISVAMIAQTITLLVSIVTVILAPKVMGVEEYGYWQLFIFYGCYVSLFHLGINDGVYLLTGGKKRDELDNRAISSQFWFSLAYQGVFIAFAAALIYGSSFDVNRVFVLHALLFFLIVCNINSYIGYIFQAINETALYSKSVILEKSILFFGLIALVVLGVPAFEPYICAFIFSKTCALLYSLKHGRAFIFNRTYPPLIAAKESLKSIRVGIKLLIAVNAGSLVIGVSRFVIDSFWSIEAFGKVSFSLSLVNFVMAFIAQISMVLFPALRQCDNEERLKYYTLCDSVLSIILPLSLLLFWPCSLFIGLWLPSYSDSVYYMALLLPICVFDGKMNILCTTFFKVLRMEKSLLCVNVASLLCCACFSYLVALLTNSIDNVILVAVFFVAARNVLSEYLVRKRLGLANNTWSSILEVTISLLFVISCVCFPLNISFLIYCFGCAAYLFVNKAECHVTLDAVKKLGMKAK